MTEYSKHQIRLLIDDVDDIRNAFEEYLRAEFAAEAYFDPPHPKREVGAEYIAPNRETEKMWSDVYFQICTVKEMIERETKTMEYMHDALETAHLRAEKIRMGLNPDDFLPFTDEDFGMAVSE